MVHSLGILLEADYKGLVSGRENPFTGLAKVFGSQSHHSTPNPLDRRPGDKDDVKSSGPSQQLTYEMMNRDSAILLAKEAEAQGVKAFGFISAAAGAPVLPARYIDTKREAEHVIAREFPKMRGVFFRPPLMWDSGRAFTVPLAAGAAAASTFNKVTGGVLGGFLGAAAIKPLKADLVADAVVEGLADEGVKGPVEVDELERLAGRNWRKTML